MLDLSSVAVEGGSKGAPESLTGRAAPSELAGDVGPLFAGRVPMPVATIRWDLLTANAVWMADYVDRHGASLAPHAKTHLSPQLADVQLRAGAWAITVADVRQLRLFHRFGLRRALLANQVCDRASLTALWSLLEEDPDFHALCFVDSVDGVVAMQAVADGRGTSAVLDVLVEVGHLGGRTGCRDDAQAAAVLDAIERAPALRLRGVTAFEGLMGGGGVGDGSGARDATADIRQLLDRAVALAGSAADRFDDGEIILTAGGSAYFDLVVEVLGGADLGRPHRVVVRSGGYLVHDHGFYRRHQHERVGRAPDSAGLAPALQVWGVVQSRPEPDLVLVNVGRRDVSHDIDLPYPDSVLRPGADPRPRPVTGWATTALNDQHAFLRVPVDADVRVGDVVGFGVSHPCTTFDKWPLLYAVDEDYLVTDAIRTYF